VRLYLPTHNPMNKSGLPAGRDIKTTERAVFFKKTRQRG